MTARYWLRFDDLCPTMRRDAWERAEALVARYETTPLLAIVPDNRDPTLAVESPDGAFWDRAREWQRRGWVVGLHGWRHVYDSRAPSLLPFKDVSEFSGHPYAEQRARIGKGLAILRDEGLDPRLFIAPGHAFDDDTLAALDAHDLRVLCDGFGFRPTRDRRGLVWIPNPTRRPRRFPFGTVTIALHTNEMDAAAFERLDVFLAAHRDRLGRDFEALVDGAARPGPVDRLYERLLLAAFRWNARRRSTPAAARSPT